MYNLDAASTSASCNIFGLGIYSGSATVSNNIIRLGVNVAEGNPIYGIYETGAANNNYNIYHNTVYLGGSTTNGTVATYAYYNNATTNLKNIRNNIFHNERNSGSGTNLNFGLRLAGTTGVTIDNNDYYANGTAGTICRLVSANYGTLALWQPAVAAISGDIHSVEIDPVFTPSTTAVSFTPGAILTGISGTGITTDYFGATRSTTTPKMGAIDCSGNPLITGTTPASRCGSGTVTLSATASGVSPAANVLWYTQATDGVAVGGPSLSYTTPSLSSTTTYYAEAVYAGCRASLRTAVVATINPIPTITGTLNVCVGLTTTLSGSGTPHGTTPWASASPTKATVSNTGVVTGVAAGTSVITYKDINGCTQTATVTVTAAPTATISYAGTPFCKSIVTAQPVTISGTNAYTGGTYGAGAGLTINSSNGSITPSSSTAGGYTVTYTIPASGGCAAVPVTTPVSIVAQPTTASNGSTQSICITGSAALSGNSATAGTGVWSVFSGPSTSAAQFANTGVYNTIFTPAGGPGNYVVRWTISNPPCTASSADATITVNNSVTPATNGSAQTICISGSAVLSGNNPGVGTGTWSVFSGPSTLATQFANVNVYNTTFTPAAGAGSYVVQWTITNPPCIASSANATITVNTGVTTATNGSAQTICSTGSATLSGNNPTTGTGVWSVVSGPSTLATQFANTGVYNTTFTPAGGIGNYVVRWTVSNAPCSPSSADATIAVIAPPTTATNGSTQTICMTTASVMLSGNNPTVGTGVWSVVSGPTTASTQFANTGVYNTTFTPAGGAGNYVVRWTISNAPCTASSADATISVKALPTTATNGSAQTICSTTASITLVGNNPSVGTGVWSVVSGPSTLATQFANASVYNTTFTPAGGAGSYVVRWTISNAPCTASSADATVIVNSPPTTATNTSTQTICNGAGATLSGNNPVTGTGGWSVVSGPSTASAQFANASAYNTIFTPSGGAGSYVIRWTISNAPCTASSADATITVTANPTIATNTSTQTICSTGSATLSGNNPVAGNGAWTVVSGPSTASGQFANTSTYNTTFTPAGGAGSYVVRWTISNAPCTPSSADATITVNSPPSTATNGSTQTICSTGSATLSGNNPVVGAGAWTVVSGPSTLSTQFANTGVYNTTFTPAAGAGNYVVRWTISNTPCTASFANATITVNAPPTTATNGSTQTICSNGSATLSGNNPTVGTGAWTVVSGPSTSSAQFASTSTYNTTFTPSGGAGSYVVRWTITNTPCAPSSANATITVNPVTATPVISSPICDGVTSVSGTSVANATITVFKNAVSQGTTTATAGGTWSLGSLTLATGNVITATAQSSGSCVSAFSTGITVLPVLTASVTIAANVTVICPGINVTFTATPTNGGASPLYQFKLNGNDVGLNSSTPTYSNNALADGDYVTCVLTSNATCVVGSPATSNTVTITVISPAAPTASVTVQPTCIVPGGTVVVTAPIGVNYEYAVDGGAYQAGTTFTGVAPGTHTLTTRLAASPSCISAPSGTLTVNANPTPLPAITPVTICQGGTGSLVATGINCVDNFTIPTLPNRIYGGWLSSSSTTSAPVGTVNTTTCSFTGPVRSYQSVPFQVSISGSYTFEMNNNTTYNGAGYITTGSFTPGSCASGTLVRVDNDGGSGDEPILGPVTLTAGITYYLVSTTEGASNVINNDYTWTITPPGGGNVMLNQPGTVEWYTASSGGTAIGTGSSFNPVGVSGSGLPNTNTAGTWSFWAACSSSPSCRTQANFTISTTATVHTVTPGTATCYNPSTPVTIGISTSTNGMPYQLNLDGVAIGSTVNGIPSSGAISFPPVTAIGTYTVTAESGSCHIPMSGSVVIKPVPIANAGADATIPCNGSIGLTGSSNSTTLLTENFGTNVNAQVTSSTSGWKIKYLYGTEPANRSEWWISYNGANPYVSNMNNSVNCIPAGGGSSGLIMLDHRIYQTIMPCDYAWDEGDQDEIAYKTTPVDARLYTSVNLSFDYQVGGTFSGSNVYDYLQVMYSLDNGATWVAVSAGNNVGSYTLYRQLNSTTNAFFSNTPNTPVTGTANVTMPSAVAGQQFLLGFRWVNDGDLTGAYVGGPMVDNISVTGAADYSWSPTTGVTGAGTATPTITQSGTYTLIVTAGNGCSASDQVVVTATSSVTINPFSPATSARCQGAGTVTYTTTANGSTSITYSLDGASLTGGNTINSSTGQVTYVAGWSGTTTITASAAGCNGPATTTHVVTVHALPTPTFTAFINPTVCSGVAVYYSTQSGQTNYTWSVPGTVGTDYTITAGGISTTNSDVTIKWLTAGNKTVTVNYTTTNGCTGVSPASHTIEVFLSPVPTFTTSPAANVCTGSPVTYTTQSGQGNYSWTIPGSSGTDYNITGGGTSTNSVTLEWLTSGSKTVNANYESADGCTGLTPATHTTIVNTPPSVTNPTPATQTVPCAGTPAAISVIASGGIGTYSYQWYSNTTASTTGGTTVGTNSSSFPPPSTVGTTYYYCEVTGVSSGCAPVKTSLTAQVIVVAAPTATVIVDECMSYATGDKYYVLVTGSGGTPPYTYPGAFYTTTISPFEGVFEINAGTSSTYTVIDNAGCSHTTGSITAPVGKPTNIVLTPTTAGNVTVDCWDNNFNKWITFRDAVSNDAILAIHDNGANLGLVTVSTYKEASAPLIWANQTGWNCTWTQHTAMRRHFKITTTAYQPSNNAVDVMLFFTDQEYLDLKSDAWNNNIAYPNPGYACTELDDVYNFNQLYVTKYSGPNEDGNYLNNAATPTGLYRVFGDNTTPSRPLTKAPYTSSGTGFQGIYGGSQTHHYVQMTVTEFSEFWLHGSSHSEALPVEMIFLQADAVNNAYIRLTWATAIEVNNDGFEVERSVDGQNWTQIGFVDGHDNATTQNDYSFNDMDVTPNVIYYYRLKQVDNDGAFEYTDIVSARLTGEATFSVKDFVPNPTMDKTSLIITATKDQDITVTFYDVIGQKMMESSHQVNKGANRFEFDLGKLAAGTYTALVSSSNEVYTKKVVLAK